MEPQEIQWAPRPATADDFPQMLAIETQVHLLAPWTERHFKEEMEKPYSQILVMTDEETDEIVGGYLVSRLLFDEIEILNVAVALPYRSLGLAKRLIRAVVGVGARKSAKRAILDVRKSNLPAIQLYHGLGFEIQQVRKGFYSNGEDAYSMRMELIDPIRDSGVF